MDGEDGVPLREKVDLPPVELRRFVLVRLDREERQVQAVLCPRETGAA
jgi:hypothetical protein